MVNSSAPIQGIGRAEARFNAAAERIARGPAAEAGDQVEWSEAMVALMQSRNDFAADLKALDMGERMTEEAIGVMKPTR